MAGPRSGLAKKGIEFLERYLPERYRTEGTTVVDMQERAKGNKETLTEAEKQSLQTMESPVVSQEVPRTPPAREPGEYEQELLGTEQGDMLAPDLMPGRPPEIPSPEGRDLQHRTATRNINLDRVKTSDDIKALIDAQAQQLGPADVRSFAETKKRAAKVDAAHLLANGKADQNWNDAQLLAVRRMLLGEAKRLHAVAQDLATRHGAGRNSVTDEEWAEFSMAKTRYQALQKVYSGKVREAARALSSMRITAAPGTKTMLRDVEDLVDSVGGRHELARQARLLSQTDPTQDPKKFGRTIGFLHGAARTAYTVWLNGLLSSPTTHLVNITSNALVQPYEMAVRGVGGVFGEARRVMGAEDTMRIGESKAEAFGALMGVLDGIEMAAGRAIHGAESPGVGRSRKVEAVDYVSKNEDGMARTVADAAMNVVSTPTRMLDSEDQFFKGIAYRREMYRLAYRKAAHEGLSGAEFDQRVSGLLKEPTEEMHLGALNAADHQTYTNTPEGLFGAAGRGAQTARRLFPPLSVIMPFVNTPANIATYVVRNLPGLNLAHTVQQLNQGGPAADMAMGRFTLSMGMLGLAWNLYANGDLAGEGSSNPRLRGVAESAGRPGNAIRIGDKWHKFDRLDPLGAMLGAMADVFDSAAYAKDPDDYANIIMAAALGLSEDLLDSTYLQQLGNIIQAIKAGSEGGVIQRGKGVMASMGASVVPAGAGYIARSLDTSPDGGALVRDAYTTTPEISLLDAIARQAKARTPFMREDLPLAIDWKGDYRTRDYGGFIDEANPIKWSAIAGDPAAKALMENRVPISRPRPVIRWTTGGGVYRDETGMKQPVHVDLMKIDGGQGFVYEEYQRFVGQARYAAVKNLVGGRGREGYNRRYLSATPDQKGDMSHWHEELSLAVAEGTQRGKKAFFRWYFDNYEEKGWPEPGSDEWNAAAAEMRPRASSPPPETPTTPWRPGERPSVRFGG